MAGQIGSYNTLCFCRSWRSWAGRYAGPRTSAGPSVTPSHHRPTPPLTRTSLALQIQSNALAALEAIDKDMAAEIMAAGCVTGDRINGLVDGVSGQWYVKFDTYHPAVDQGMPVTRVVSRVELQRILAKYAMKYGGEDVIAADTKVVSYAEDKVNGRARVRASPFLCAVVSRCVGTRAFGCF